MSKNKKKKYRGIILDESILEIEKWLPEKELRELAKELKKRTKKEDE